MSRFAAAMVLSACYGAAPAVGVPCSSMGDCPLGQHCNYGVVPPSCAAADARPADAAPDAPLPCTTDANCTAASPICDPVGLICRGCIADTECENDVCTEHDGQCVNSNNTLFVAPGGVASGNCPRSAPCTIGWAIGRVANNQHVIAIADGAYTESLDLRSFGANSLIISGPDRDPAEVIVGPITAGASGVRTADTGKAIIVEGITISNAPAHGVDNLGNLTLSRVAIQSCAMHGIVSGGSHTLTVLDTSIMSNGWRGVEVDNTTVEIARSVITSNSWGGIDLDTAAFTIENTIITSNGGVVGSTGGIRFSNIAAQTPQIVRFNTLESNGADINQPPGVDCGGAAINLDSSIIMDSAVNATPLSSTCLPTYSLFSFSVTLPAGMGNLTGDPAFSAAGDYRIGPSSAAREAANPMATLGNDIDGQARPQGGNRRDIGADEVP